MVENNWDGRERREGYCPVHNIKCEEIKSLREDSKKKLPIWVFTFICLLVGGIIAYQMHMVERYVDQSSIVLKKLSLGLREVSHNQRIIMNKIDIDYEPLPDYERDLDIDY